MPQKSLVAVFIILVACSSFAYADDAISYGSPLIPRDIDVEQYRPFSDPPEKYPPTVYSYEWSLYEAYQNLYAQDCPVWSPDGQWIAFTERTSTKGVWIVPAEGGTPIRIFDAYQMVDGYVVKPGELTICCFTPDSREVVFGWDIVDAERGSEITITVGENQFSYSTTKLCPTLMAVDIDTGKTRVIADDHEQGQYSRDGRLFASIDIEEDYMLIVTDTATGDSWPVIDMIYNYRFSADGEYIMYTLYNTLYRIPVKGGEPEMVDIPIMGTAAINRFDISPTDEWIIYKGGGGPRSVAGSYNLEDISKLYAYNTISGASYAIYPVESAVESNNFALSYDGTKIAYVRHDWNETKTYLEIYVKDFNEDTILKIAETVDVAETIPAGFELDGNFPNPFNPSTTIEFTLPDAGFTELTVYNTAGQKVRNLVSHTLTAGKHSVVWDGRDTRGLTVSSGVYVTKLRRGDNTVSRRMMLVK